MSYVAPPVVGGLGERLWDGAADGRRPGGAPANFACHAAQLGAEAWAVSAVGDDDDGAELVRALQAR
ncbi:MAG: PfkB family carbohydrate kinase, partial [Planctomycetota bacterium]